ncbi:hypothetical protein RHMOL_Rhmol09G0158700 [Rhododendron molle]|uniref:Uncharacterized protein n=1 Tax=Rhododendron molle TaxID=49168 RepID=A0ACC0MEF6_RHOML|nr:hypothetical protein RHMOL_Rhmol09G0158700 [Rhododendron molle]
MVFCSGVCSTVLRSSITIRRLGSHLDNKRLSIISCRDEIRAVGCTIRRLGSVHHCTEPTRSPENF